MSIGTLAVNILVRKKDVSVFISNYPRHMGTGAADTLINKQDESVLVAMFHINNKYITS